MLHRLASYRLVSWLTLAASACVGSVAPGQPGESDSDASISSFAGADGSSAAASSDASMSMPSAAEDAAGGQPSSDAQAGATRDAATLTEGSDAATGPGSLPLGSAMQPMTMLSVGRPVVVSIGVGAALVNDNYLDSMPWDINVADKPWAAIDLGTGPSKVVVQLYSAQADTVAAAYRIETSANSTDGRNGTWSPGVTVTSNPRSNRVHLLDFGAQRWLRVTLEGAAANQAGRVRLNEISVRDASRGSADCWVFMGDSITAQSIVPGPAGFSGLVHSAHPAYYPVLVNAGVPGNATNDALAALDSLLAVYPDIQNWVVSYGTNDTVSNDTSFLMRYKENLYELIRRLRAADKTVYMPRIPFKLGYDVAPYNVALDEVVAGTGTFPGPDLYGYFAAHQDQLLDGKHPTVQGEQAINQLWADSVSRLYP